MILIEKLVLDFLRTKLKLPVYLEEPARKPAFYVVVEKTGSAKENHICTAVLAVQSYGESMQTAAELNARVKAALDQLPELDGIARSRLNSDYNYTDPQTKRYRYQAVYDIAFYESEAI